MRNLKVMLVAALALLVWSCNDTNEDTNTTGDASLQGAWKLVKVEGSIAGFSSTFAPGVITWNFNVPSNTITVINNNTDPNKEDVLNSGNYVFGINNPDAICTEALLVDTFNYGCIDISGNQMVVDQSFADGIKMTFKK